MSRPVPMLRIATCSALPEPDPDHRPLELALAAAGVTFEWVAWDDPNATWDAPIPTVIRTTWNYVQAHQAFVAWTQRVAAAAPLWNPPDIIAGNVHKGYLLQLANRGGDATKSHTAALNALDEARKIVARRHRDLHDGRPRLRELGNNATFYLYGYLFMADTLCFWERELRQMELETGMFAGAAPSCLL